mmetsp:Transcript_100511/g.230747  ORF Transcript_100511/g.230747 Transcript_100511/m.230747 type:complete len:247 (+) Transcript_100511:6597-7337(+)|eukprot:CAMPEP_0204338984 /NCGR_PEP_ID=MMETSP0469-20131031/21467_1 /ASSEMBLY_ACC=CAM_ASM_000384 /TAXON_ID=2969 /ORGANISM="Oxyrrhis marina" /LENGTH=246 /DNA_ID=CAMNT_0051323257 /DNA_START=30 /DNA_END=770 /DNA_ORIENTATION=+
MIEPQARDRNSFSSGSESASPPLPSRASTVQDQFSSVCSTEIRVTPVQVRNVAFTGLASDSRVDESIQWSRLSAVSTGSQHITTQFSSASVGSDLTELHRRFLGDTARPDLDFASPDLSNGGCFSSYGTDLVRTRCTPVIVCPSNASSDGLSARASPVQRSLASVSSDKHSDQAHDSRRITSSDSVVTDLVRQPRRRGMQDWRSFSGSSDGADSDIARCESRASSGFPSGVPVRDAGRFPRQFELD